MLNLCSQYARAFGIHTIRRLENVLCSFYFTDWRFCLQNFRFKTNSVSKRCFHNVFSFSAIVENNCLYTQSHTYILINKATIPSQPFMAHMCRIVCPASFFWSMSSPLSVLLKISSNVYQQQHQNQQQQ